MSDIPGDSSLGRTTSDFNQGLIHPRRAQCPCRRSLSAWPAIEGRMVSESVSLQPTMCFLGNSPDRYVLNQFVSPMREPQAWKTDALSLVWNNMYMYPPTTLWNRIMPKLSHEKPRALVIAPWWPTQSWWSTLSLWSIQPAIPLPFRADLLTQPHSVAHCTSLSMLNLHAWLIQPGHTQLSPSLMKWRNESRLLSESQPAKCIQLK